MPSQYQKRKAKDKVVPAEAAAPVTNLVTPAAAPEQGQDLTHTAYDVYLDADNITYKIVTIKYDPVTSEAVVTEIKTIGRHIGLVHDNQKRALQTLKTY